MLPLALWRVVGLQPRWRAPVVMQSLGTGAGMECLRAGQHFYPFIGFSDSQPRPELPLRDGFSLAFAHYRVLIVIC